MGIAAAAGASGSGTLRQEENRLEVSFFGVRGSTPSPGASFVRYGGHTSCVGIARDGELPRLLLDAGTGLMNVEEAFGDEPFQGSILLGHLHWDHTHGIPFFNSGFVTGHEITLLIPEQQDEAAPGPPSAMGVLERAMSPPHFPIVPSELGPGWDFEFVAPGTHEIEGYQVLARDIPHKGGRTFGYRVSDGKRAIAYLSDHCPTVLGPGRDGIGEFHDTALELAEGVDLLIHDAQNVRDEFPSLAYLGHALTDYAVALGEAADVGTVVLFHHGPRRTDDEVDAIVAGFQSRRVKVVAAAEGLVVAL